MVQLSTSPIVSRRYASLLWLLTGLFFLRIIGQVIQHWLPQPFLPLFRVFQGSDLPYWALLSVQLMILVVITRLARSVQHGRLIPSRRTGRLLAWVGNIYMIGALLRITVGLAVPAAPAWFSTWIPAISHVILAGFVLILSLYHLCLTAEPQ